MLSSDKNVESIAQLVESVKNYVGLQGEYLKLDVIQKIVRLVTALTLTIVLLLLGIAFLFYLSFACVYWLEPLTGSVRHVCDGMEGTELCFSPLGMQSAAGTLTRLTVADTSGGVQEFVRQNDFFRLNMRLDLREVTGENELELIASPLFCPLARESWLAFIAECPRGTIVAACPAPLGQRSWSDLPWRGGRWGWWHLYEGFHSLSSILVHDGLIFLLGKEENRSVVKTIDVVGSRLTETAEAPQNAVLTVADGRPVIAVPSSDGISAVRLSVQPSPSSYVLYTLFR